MSEDYEEANTSKEFCIHVEGSGVEMEMMTDEDYCIVCHSNC